MTTESSVGSVDSSATNSFTVSRHSPYRVCPHSEVIDWPVSSASSVAVVQWLVCSTAVREDQGSNLTRVGCVYLECHCDMQSWAWAVHLYCGA